MSSVMGGGLDKWYCNYDVEIPFKVFKDFFLNNIKTIWTRYRTKCTRALPTYFCRLVGDLFVSLFTYLHMHTRARVCMLWFIIVVCCIIFILIKACILINCHIQTKFVAASAHSWITNETFGRNINTLKYLVQWYFVRAHFED